MEPDAGHMLQSLAFSLSQMTASTQVEADAAAAARSPLWKAHHEKLKANPLTPEQARIYGSVGVPKLPTMELRAMLQQAVADNRPIDVNFHGNCGNAPLHKACHDNDKERVRMLLEFGKTDTWLRTCNGGHLYHLPC